MKTYKRWARVLHWLLLSPLPSGQPRPHRALGTGNFCYLFPSEGKHARLTDSFYWRGTQWQETSGTPTKLTHSHHFNTRRNEKCLMKRRKTKKIECFKMETIQCKAWDKFEYFRVVGMISVIWKGMKADLNQIYKYLNGRLSFIFKSIFLSF